MPRKKALRVAELSAMQHVFLRPHDGSSASLLEYVAAKPVALDIGCGSGDTTVALAAADPSRLYLGVDLRGARLHRGAAAAARLGLTNVAFTVAPILALAKLLPDGIGDEGWFFFPDPFLKRRAAKHRLTAPAHLSAYRRLFRAGARLHLRTDSAPMFEYSRRTLERAQFTLCRAVTSAPPYEGTELTPPVLSRYEARFRAQGRTLHVLEFQVR